MRPRDVLAENFKKLKNATPAYRKLPAITAAGGGSNGWLGRLQKADVAATVDNLESLARTFGVQPWQLLVPGLVVETGKSDRPKVSEPAALPFSSELLIALQELGPDQIARLERVMRAHLDMSEDTGR